MSGKFFRFLFGDTYFEYLPDHRFSSLRLVVDFLLFFSFKKISYFTLRKCVVLQPLLGPGLSQREPPFFSIPSSSPSILAFIGSVMHPSGRHTSFYWFFLTDFVSWDSPLRNFFGILSSSVLMM
jgi:hypothetical protein